MPSKLNPNHRRTGRPTGRPVVVGGDPRLALTVTPQLRAAVEQLAARDGVSLSEVLRRAVRAWCDLAGIAGGPEPSAGREPRRRPSLSGPSGRERPA